MFVCMFTGFVTRAALAAMQPLSQRINHPATIHCRIVLGRERSLPDNRKIVSNPPCCCRQTEPPIGNYVGLLNTALR